MVWVVARCGQCFPGELSRYAAACSRRPRVAHSDTGCGAGGGFRPFVYRLAARFGLRGHVENTIEGVRVYVEGGHAVLEGFLDSLRREPPPLACIESMDASWCEAMGCEDFEIHPSTFDGEAAGAILPDLATCPDCLADIRNPASRFYRYPFTNCTHCGPRFSVIHRLPYDRAHTAMADFEMCRECRAEYDDPHNRRFHAQPTACPACGPQLALWDCQGVVMDTRHEALLAAACGGAGGADSRAERPRWFHLIADARNEAAVRDLRQRKGRGAKPFALMYPSVEAAGEHCAIGRPRPPCSNRRKRPLCWCPGGKRPAWLRPPRRGWIVWA